MTTNKKSPETVSNSPPNERELFIKLCEKYGAQPNKDGTGLIVKKENGEVEPITPENLREIIGI